MSSKRCRIAPVLRLLALSVLIGSLAGCDSGTGAVSTGKNQDESDSCTGAACVDSDTGTSPDDAGARDTTAPDTDTPPDAQIISLAIEPFTVEILSVDGSQPTVDFNIIATYDDGQRAPYTGPIEFKANADRLGYIDAANGIFTAHGVAGGTTQILATPLGAFASLDPAAASVTVKLQRTVFGDGTSAQTEAQFGGTPVDDPARAATIVYPLNNAVMPQNVFPADIQWLNGAPGDLFKIQMKKSNAEVNAYLLHSGPGFANHWLANTDAWRALAQTDIDQPMSISVTRLEAATGELIASAPVSIRFERGSISGSVYYWDIAAGRIVRINDGTAVRDEFMPHPPKAASNEYCVGCHAVSNSGRYMVGRLGGGDNIGAVFDLTKDLTGPSDQVPTEFPRRDDGTRWWFSAWNPDDTRLIVTQFENAGQSNLALVDPFTGDVIPPAAGTLPGTGSGVTQPDWSTDGAIIAYVSELSTWGGDVRDGNISVLPVTGPDSFGTPQVILNGANMPEAIPAGVAPSYPTFSPDSQWLAFGFGTGSRSEDVANNVSAIYRMRTDGTERVRLDNASGGPQGTESFQPRFSPFETENYFWLSYLSRRDYGNAEAGTKGSGRQQIWVSAVAKYPTPGEDPSEVGFWLPGQSTQSMNIAAYWAPRACRQDAEGCSVGSECCSGECLPGGSDGALVCSPPPPERCHQAGETCSDDSGCCGDTPCVDNICTPPLPEVCREFGEACSFESPCCSGMQCHPETETCYIQIG